MILASETHGNGPSLTFVHGFTQTRASWNLAIENLSDRYTCQTIDAPGHGESADGKLSLIECGDAIAETMATGTLIGYSMGARMALHAALRHPEKVKRLVLISGTPGIEVSDERATRVASDEALASHIEDIGVAAFVAEWLQNPMFAGLSREKAQVEERIKNSPQGLADSLRHAGTGTQAPLWEELSKLEIPTLIIAGATDKKFSDIASRMHSGMPQSTLVVVQGSGHTVHLERPDEFLVILRDWLRTTDSVEG